MEMIVKLKNKLIAAAFLIILVSGLGIGPEAHAKSTLKEKLVTASIEEVAKRVREYGKVHGKDEVLAVFDLDNTLLAMTQDLGSDQWFGWQADLLSQKSFRWAVGKNMGDLLRVQALLFAAGDMRPTETGAPEIIRGLQSEGYKTIVLTSRGHSVRSATEREILRNGYDFRKTPLGSTEGFGAEWMPYDAASFKEGEAGFSKEEWTAWKLGEARTVSYQNGIYMTQGMHKGAMLRHLLKKTDEDFDAIVFADDHEKHSIRMQEAFSTRGEELTTYRYSREDPVVERFQKNKKTAVIRKWNSLKEAVRSSLDTVF